MYWDVCQNQYSLQKIATPFLEMHEHLMTERSFLNHLQVGLVSIAVVDNKFMPFEYAFLH